jgi:hypothetical protein
MPGPNGPEFQKPVSNSPVQGAVKAGLAGLLGPLSETHMAHLQRGSRQLSDNGNHQDIERCQYKGVGAANSAQDRQLNCDPETPLRNEATHMPDDHVQRVFTIARARRKLRMILWVNFIQALFQSSLREEANVDVDGLQCTSPNVEKRCSYQSQLSAPSPITLPLAFAAASRPRHSIAPAVAAIRGSRNGVFSFYFHGHQVRYGEGASSRSGAIRIAGYRTALPTLRGGVLMVVLLRKSFCSLCLHCVSRDLSVFTHLPQFGCGRVFYILLNARCILACFRD